MHAEHGGLAEERLADYLSGTGFGNPIFSPDGNQGLIRVNGFAGGEEILGTWVEDHWVLETVREWIY